METNLSTGRSGVIGLPTFASIALVSTAACTPPRATQAPPRPQPAALRPPNETLEWMARDQTTPPKPVRSENPAYPSELRAQAIRGTVVVEFTIGTDGKVSRAAAVHSPHPRLSQLAVDAVRRWEYIPAQRQGRAVETTFQARIDFQP